VGSFWRGGLGQGLRPGGPRGGHPGPGGDFEADVADIRASFSPQRSTTTLKVSRARVATRPAILDSFDEGASVMSYVGHGGRQVWSSANVLRSGTWRSRRNPPADAPDDELPDGYFVAPNLEALREPCSRRRGGGNRRLLPQRAGLDGPAHQYHRAVMAADHKRPAREVGDALLVRPERLRPDRSHTPQAARRLPLLGDPAMRIR